jgi:hypothetical protein
MKTLANYDYFYIIPQLISRVSSFRTESQAMPGILASNILKESTTVTIRLRIDRG